MLAGRPRQDRRWHEAATLGAGAETSREGAHELSLPARLVPPFRFSRRGALRRCRLAEARVASLGGGGGAMHHEESEQPPILGQGRKAAAARLHSRGCPRSGTDGSMSSEPSSELGAAQR